MTNSDNYAALNLSQEIAEHDDFTAERYAQFARKIDASATSILDIGCSTGVGGVVLASHFPGATISGLDCVAERLAQLPDAYSKSICGFSTDIPVEDESFDAVVAGEFVEHLYPADVDKSLCEMQRVLRVGGVIVLTTPNPSYLRNRIEKLSVLGGAHLTQHHPSDLKMRLRWHGFRSVRVEGSGRVSRHLGTRVPFLPLYGSYLVHARKV